MEDDSLLYSFGDCDEDGEDEQVKKYTIEIWYIVHIQS